MRVIALIPILAVNILAVGVVVTTIGRAAHMDDDTVKVVDLLLTNLLLRLTIDISICEFLHVKGLRILDSLTNFAAKNVKSFDSHDKNARRLSN